MDIRAVVTSRRNEVLAAAARHGASNVRLFGSVSRGQANDESDIDFLVVLEPGRSLLDRAALKIELEELFGRTVDVATEKGLKAKFRDRILREAISI